MAINIENNDKTCGKCGAEAPLLIKNTKPAKNVVRSKNIKIIVLAIFLTLFAFLGVGFYSLAAVSASAKPDFEYANKTRISP